MPETEKDLLKAKFKQADGHLFTAIDRLVVAWKVFHPHHKEKANELADLMVSIERSRFLLAQFYGSCWGGNPVWLLQSTEIAPRLRELRMEHKRLNQNSSKEP